MKPDGVQLACSVGQRRIWLLHQIDPQNPSLNIAERWRLQGKVPDAHLERAFSLMIARHPALRTTIADTGGEPVQVIEPQVSFHVPVIDLSGLPETAALAEADRLARLEAFTPFNLSARPLLRVTQLRLSIDVSVVLVTVHRIVGDDWSMRILEQEVREICAALHLGQQPTLPDVVIGYGEVSARQTERRIATQQADAEFWTAALQGVGRFELPTDHPRPPVLTANGSTVSVELEREVVDGLEALAGKIAELPGDIVLAALLTLLHRHTGNVDIAIGIQFAARDEPGCANLFGLFSNTVVLRTRLADDPGFAALLVRVRDGVAAALQHQCIAPEQLMEIVRPERDLSRNPLYSVIVDLQPAGTQVRASSGFTLTRLPPCLVTTSCDLRFSTVQGPAGWQISCEFNVDLFDQQTIIRLLAQLRTLLRAVAANPTCAISGLPILDAAERRALVVSHNRTDVSYPQQLTLPQLLQAQFGADAGARALMCGEHTMTRAELEAASNRLARELRRRGVAPGQRAAIFLDRSPELLVAVLAVLKSGGAYIPLDPVYPVERLQQVFENSRPALVITRAALHQRLQDVTTPALLIDVESVAIAAHSPEPLEPSASPADPAYIIYTSGSTGRPKGVVVHHRALVNLLCAMRRQPGMTGEDIVVSVTTISFDIAVLDLLLPLMVGATLVLATEQEMTDGDALLWLLRRRSATYLQATPATWQLLLEAGWQGRPALKMLCGGEALSRKLADRLLECGGELWNMYGPTETTVWSSALRVEAGDRPVAIGGPIANTQFYVLDGHGQLVPHGVPGELFIGGDGVALGYLDLPDVSSERFVPDKFRKRPGARLYRTGDVVRMNQCGTLEYLGRTDHQIKLRGYRIELGDIEAVLLRHPDIAAAVAVLGHDRFGGGAIWAYVVPHRAHADTAATLPDALRAGVVQSLPGYMRPASIVVLDALPRTPNGKIDRRALPVPAPIERQVGKPAQPLTVIERRLEEIWRSLLGPESIDRTADFFALGGHSLLAARLVARIEAEFGQRLSLLTLFKAPTLGEQARLLMQDDQREYDFRQVVRLQPNGSQPPLIAIHNTGVYYYNLSSRLGPEQPLTALQLFDPSIVRQSLPETLAEIAAEYVRLIQKFQATGPYKLIGWCAGGVLAFEVARQLTAAGHEVALLAIIDAWAPGHERRLSWPRALLADYSYRLQLIGAAWRRVTSGEQSLSAFVLQRTLSKRLLRWIGHLREEAPAPVTFDSGSVSAESYDQWLLAYLDRTEKSYEPGPYPGRVMLLCSAREPRGLFLDPLMGWGAFALGGIDIGIIDGDHFTMFRGRGLQQMAAHIAAVSERDQDARSRGAF